MAGVTLQLASPAFPDGGPIPARHSCDGENVSPELRWSGVPPLARSLALIVDDPDAPGGEWVHWVLYDLPAHMSGLPEDVPQSQYIPQAAKQGINGFGHLGYGGPCPPPGRAHRYRFKLFALDRALELRPGASRTEVETAMAPYLVANGQLTGTFKR